jgi:subfamily B ATP-binding cassette protein MsbA
MVVLAATTAAFAFLTGPALTYLLSGGQARLPVPGWLAWAVPPSVGFIPWLVVVLALAKGLAYLGQFYLSGHFGQNVVADLRRDLFVKLSGMSPLQLAHHRSGDLLARFGADVAAVELAAVYSVASYVRDGLQVLSLGAFLFILNWRLALVAMMVTSLGAPPAAWLTGAVLRRTREAQAHLGALAAQLKEGIVNLRTVQAFNAFDAEQQRFATQARVHGRALERAAWARSVVPAVMEVLGAAGIAGALGWTLRHRGLPPEQLVSFLVTLVLIYQPLKELGRSTQFAQAAAAAGERLLPLLDDGRGEESESKGEAPKPEVEVAFSGVRFSYGGRRALDGLDLPIPAGKVTALVGPSGAGKSTVGTLLLRFAEPSEGEILLDGAPVATYSRDSVRRCFALVTQEPLLFAGSVEENLLLARPDATRDELRAACRTARAMDFIDALPKGFDTPVGEGGVTLSGGQRQRLCLARALLSGAPILLLDEATSNLDPESEAEVQTALADALKGRTALVIAHRLATVRGADVIHVMDQGRVVETGSHPDLLAKGGVYAGLWRLQHRDGGEA